MKKMSEFIVYGDLFSRYCKIKTGYSQDMHIYKIVALIESDIYCDVPLCDNSVEVIHNQIVPVLLVIHCGLEETKVRQVALSDCEIRPIADVTEVVRCKDCEYFTDENPRNHQGFCSCECKETNYGWEFFPYSYDFCSYAKRKKRS